MTSTQPNKASAAPAKCTGCDRPLDLPVVCTGCHRLYPSSGLSHFELLGLPAAFDLDLNELRRRYFRLSREIHPDRQSAGESGVPCEALRVSALANRAYEILLHDVSRAEYLLELAGGPSAVDDKSVPQDVLTQTLMLREEIEEAKAVDDAAALANHRIVIRESYDRLLAEIGGLARQLPDELSVQTELRRKLNSIKYYQRMLEQL